MGNFKSQYHNISCGIPQGSVMGPLLFNIVINDLPSATKSFDFVMYADDTTLVSTLETFGRTCNVKEIGNLIGQVSEFNFLGITIDENITWNPHIRNTSIKIARVIGILRKLKRIFPRHILRLIYNSLIHPHLLYGLSLWGFKQKRITVLQKKSCTQQTFLEDM